VTKSAVIVVIAVVAALLTGCTATPNAATTRAPLPSVGVVTPTTGGGCGDTQVSDGTSPPPAWALEGFNGWPGIPWAATSPPTAVAVLFTTELVANGINNKILWVTQTPTNQLAIVARPLNEDSPIVTLDNPTTGGNQTPSYVDLPSAGCWAFQLRWGGGAPASASLDLWVLPAGSVPSRA
jgi:hypothetical protein